MELNYSTIDNMVISTLNLKVGDWFMCVSHGRYKYYVYRVTNDIVY